MLKRPCNYENLNIVIWNLSGWHLKKNAMVWGGGDANKLRPTDSIPCKGQMRKWKHVIYLSFKRGTQHLKQGRDFPGGPVVKTPYFQHRGHGFDAGSGN